MKTQLLTILFLFTSNFLFSQYKFKSEEEWKQVYTMIELSRKSQCFEAINIFDQLKIDTIFKHKKSFIAIANCIRKLGNEDQASLLIDNAVQKGILKRSTDNDSITHTQIAERYIIMYLEDQGAWSLRNKFVIDPGVRENLEKGGIILKELTPKLRRLPALELHKLHVKEMEELIQHYGFPTAEMVGHFGLKGVKLVILHSEKAILEKYEEEYKNTFGSYMYAYLIDKKRVANGEKQLYGTQGDFDEDKNLIFYPIEDEANVNIRRMKADMEPLEIYAKNLGVENYKVPVHNKR